MHDDALLLHRYAATRDVEAFSELLRRHGGLVYGTCLRQCGDRSLAEDAAQECFLALAIHAGEIRQSLTAWLHTVAMHAASRLRRNRREHPLEVMPEPSAPQPVLEAWRLLAPRLDQALCELPDELRTILTMRYLEGSSQPEIAAALGISQPTVSRRLEQGIARLRHRLAEHLDDRCVSSALGLVLVPAPLSLMHLGAKIALAGVGATAPATAAAAAPTPLLSALQSPGLLFGSLGLMCAIAVAGWASMHAHHASGENPAPRVVANARHVGAVVSDPLTPPPAPAPAPSVLALPVTATVHRWPLDQVVDLLLDQLPTQQGARLEIMPCADYPLVDCACAAQPLGPVLDAMTAHSGWRWRARGSTVYVDRNFSDDVAPRLPAVPAYRAEPSHGRSLRPAGGAFSAPEEVVAGGDLDACGRLLASLAGTFWDTLATTSPQVVQLQQLAVFHALAAVGGSWQTWMPRGNPLSFLAGDLPAQQGVVAAWRRCRLYHWPITPFHCYLAATLHIDALGGDLLELVQDPTRLVPGVDGPGEQLVRVRTRQAAIYALGRLGYRPGLPLLQQLISPSSHDPDRMAVVTALGEIGDPTSLPLLQALPHEGDWIWGATIYVATDHLAPAAMPGLIAGGGPVLWGDPDAFISYPVPALLPQVLGSARTPSWWNHLAYWKGTGRLPASDLLAAIQASGAGPGVPTDRLPLDALAARSGDDAALDRVIDAVLAADTLLTDASADDQVNLAQQLAARLAPARSAHLVQRVMASFDPAHATARSLALLAAARPSELPARLIAAWPQADAGTRTAIIRYLAAERSTAALDFLVARCEVSPDAEQCTLALQWSDLHDDVLRRRLVAMLVNPDAIVGVELASHGLAGFPDTVAEVADFLARVDPTTRIDAGLISHLTDHQGITPDQETARRLIPVLLGWLQQSHLAPVRHACVEWLRHEIARDWRPERHQVISHLLAALPTETDAGVIEVEKHCLQEFLDENGAMDGQSVFYSEHQIMAGALDDLASVAVLDQDRRAVAAVLAGPPPARLPSNF